MKFLLFLLTIYKAQLTRETGSNVTYSVVLGSLLNKVHTKCNKKECLYI